MPYCDPCARHWTPTSMRPDGSCPTCGQVLERRHPLVTPGTTSPDPADEDDAAPSAPWHFKVLLVALAVYLVWRGIQGVDWIASRL